MNKKIFYLLAVFVFVIIIFLGIIPSLEAVGEINYCCEKTIDGAWCQNAPAEECNPNFDSVPTSCEATSFCKLGCCYDSQEGTCMENTPQTTCNKNGGVWSGESAECQIPQCELGCCFVGDQAAYVSQTRCKRLSAIYGLETNYRTDISNEMECIASATSDVKGACVFEKDYERTCKFTTQKECKNMEAEMQEGSVEFHPEYLCSADELATNCGPSEKTTCVEGKDEVFFVDTCGNLANIYDASRIKDKTYWTKLVNKDESCNPDSNNANSASCGNCDYYLGSTCKVYDRTEDTTRPSVGDNICRDLGCTYEKQRYEHGETWCATNTKVSNSPGSEYFRMVCYNGEVTIEPCAAFREEICIESEINGYSTAACRVNRWQDCVAQDSEKDCENTDKRDCEWILSGEIKYDDDGNKEEDSYVCVPKNPPGFDFWNPEGDAENICSVSSTECVAKFEKGILPGSDWKCVENCHCCVNGKDAEGHTYKGCTGQYYEEYKDEVCSALGDCGQKQNYIGRKGYNDDENPLLCDGKDCYWVL